MEIFKVIAFAFIALFLSLLFKDTRKDISIQISLVAGILIFLFMLPKLTVIMSFLQTIANKAQIDVYYLNIIFKILGISYLTSFSAELCKDAGEGALASKVEFSGKILILALSIPIIIAVLDSILKIL